MASRYEVTRRKRSRVRRINRGLIHCIAQCKECDWTEEAYRKASRAATDHAAETGHAVLVERALVHEVTVAPSRNKEVQGG